VDRWERSGSEPSGYCVVMPRDIASTELETRDGEEDREQGGPACGFVRHGHYDGAGRAARSSSSGMVDLFRIHLRIVFPATRFARWRLLRCTPPEKGIR